jgi:quercetin dioxygenase-like cupin family protein
MTVKPGEGEQAMFLSRPILAIVAVAALWSVGAAASAQVIVTADTAKWQPGTGAFKGAQIATVVGNPAASGAYYAYLLKLPDGMQVPPHFHGMSENVNVISGTLMVGLGDTVVAAKMLALPTGGIASIPGGVHHYAIAKGDTIIEVSGVGPDTITFLH